jgi:hypothetical protein
MFRSMCSVRTVVVFVLALGVTLGGVVHEARGQNNVVPALGATNDKNYFELAVALPKDSALDVVSWLTKLKIGDQDIDVSKCTLQGGGGGAGKITCQGYKIAPGDQNIYIKVRLRDGTYLETKKGEKLDFKKVG